MKNLLTYILVLFSSVVLAQQKGIVTYEIVIGDDPRALLRETDTQRLRNAQSLAEELSFNLYFSSTESFFEINEKPIDTDYFSDLFAESATNPEYSVYSDLKKQSYSYSFFSTFKSETFLLTDRANYQWNITDESKTIDHILVYKAIGKTRDNLEIEAWFAPEIPISAGPEIYMGLPGLILELQKGYTKYVSKKIEFTDQYTQKIKNDLKGISINEAEKEKMLQEKINNFK